MSEQKNSRLEWLLPGGRKLLRDLPRPLLSNVGTLVLVTLMLCGYHAWAAPGAAPPVQGAIPGLLSYQGYLTDASGSPLNGNVDITFRLYDAAGASAALWEEAHTGPNAVPVENGLFNVLLGSLNPISAPVWDSGALYLGIQVSSDPEMTPREELSSTPYAMHALTVPDRTITNEKIALSYMSTSPSSNVSISSTSSSSPDEVVSLDVDFPVDGVYLIIATVVSRSHADDQMGASIWDESGQIPGSKVYNTHPVSYDEGRETATIIVLAPFSAGSHTIRLMAWVSVGPTAMVKPTSQLIVIPFGQP